MPSFPPRHSSCKGQRSKQCRKDGGACPEVRSRLCRASVLRAAFPTKGSFCGSRYPLLPQNQHQLKPAPASLNTYQAFYLSLAVPFMFGFASPTLGVFPWTVLSTWMLWTISVIPVGSLGSPGPACPLNQHIHHAPPSITRSQELLLCPCPPLCLLFLLLPLCLDVTSYYVHNTYLEPWDTPQVGESSIFSKHQYQ